MCSVNLWRFLGKNNKPENQEVNEINKDEGQNGNGGNGPESAGCGGGQDARRAICVCFHFTVILRSFSI